MSEFDLASFDELTKAQEDGIDVAIEHPSTGDDLGIVIKVAGPDSERQRKARDRVINQRLKTKRMNKMTADDIAEEGLLILARSVISWDGVIVEGERLECTVENAITVFRRFPFIREQVDVACGDRAGFMKR